MQRGTFDLFVNIFDGICKYFDGTFRWNIFDQPTEKRPRT